MAIFTNRASLTYSGGTADSNTVTGELIEVLSAQKAAIPETYTAGSVTTYLVTLDNSGAADLAGITVTDDLGAFAFGTETLVPLTYTAGSARYFVDGTLQPAPTVTEGEQLEFSGLSLPAGSTAMLVYQAEANSFAPLSEGSEITNTAVASGAGLISAVSAQATVTLDSSARLELEKQLSPARVAENGQLTYSFIIRNYGTEAVDEASGAVFTDTFSPVLADITATVGGTAIEEGTGYTYSQADGVFTTAAGVITVPAATVTQDPTTGEWTTVPGETVVVITGTVTGF